ncbi:MAG: hypothetical protein ABI780_01455 [Ardenticatenales bacterium]
MTKRRGQGRRPGAGANAPRATGGGSGRGWTLGAIAVFAAGAAAMWFVGGRSGAGGGPAAIGGATGCQALPRFAATLGVGPRAMFGTSVKGVMGLAVVDPDAQGAGRQPVYQHPSWDDAGYLGPFVYDRKGDIYAAPVPLVSLEDNPPDEQNRVFRVDSTTQQLALFVDLPAAAAPTGGNPFGVIGLAYDCDGDRLYAASVAGSTADAQHGRIYAIDLASGAASVVLDERDAFGVAVFNGAHGKRLYYGLAREPELYSIALGADGGPDGEPRRELSVADAPNGTSDKIRRIRFTPGPTMALHAYDFGYSLQVASERTERVFEYSYEASTDAWRFDHEVVAGAPTPGSEAATTSP